MRKLAASLVVAGATAAAMTLAPSAQAAELGANQVVSTIDAPMGVLSCTTTYDSKLAANPNKPKPTYGVLFVNATGTYNYVLYDAGATVAYGVCILI